MGILLAALAAMAWLGTWYHGWQNSRAAMGGAISEAKALWLFYALFHYFVFSVWAYFHWAADNRLHGLLALFVGVMYGRLLLQGLLMFVFKAWVPPMGMAYNLFTVLAMAGYLLWPPTLWGMGTLGRHEVLTVSFAVLAVGILLTDTAYAYGFYQLVGRQTTGKRAIWYAAREDPAFDQLNAWTYRLNVLFLLCSALLLLALALG